MMVGSSPLFYILRPEGSCRCHSVTKMLNAFQSRLIHVSLGTATASSRSSYTPSTRGCDVSRRQNVVCCQQVTIINGAATLACPRSVIQPKRLVDPATTAPLTGRLESVHDPKLPPIPLAFVCQHPAKFAEARVCDRPRQLAVLRTIPRTLRSSIAIRSNRRTRPVVILSR